MEPSIIEDIRTSQKVDAKLERLRQNVTHRKLPSFVIQEDETLRFPNKLCVPNKEELKRRILEEAHNTHYLVLPGGTKMYRDLRQFF